jgi:pyruvate,water dikinase
MKTHKPFIYTLDFAEVGLKDISRVGGKNASLGELFNALKSKGVGVIDGFATTADAYRALLAQGQLEYELRSLLSDFDPEDVEELRRRGHAARVAVLDMPLPKELRNAITSAYEQLCSRLGHEPELAVRSSATAEDLPRLRLPVPLKPFLTFVVRRRYCVRRISASHRSLPIVQLAIGHVLVTTS